MAPDLPRKNGQAATDPESDNQRTQLRKGVLEFAILLTIAQKERYASEILNELKRADLLVVEGTLYPLLSRLTSAGTLEYSWVESTGGPPRKYYALTERGRSALAQHRLAWQELSESISSLL